MQSATQDEMITLISGIDSSSIAERVMNSIKIVGLDKADWTLEVIPVKSNITIPQFRMARKNILLFTPIFILAGAYIGYKLAPKEDRRNYSLTGGLIGLAGSISAFSYAYSEIQNAQIVSEDRYRLIFRSAKRNMALTREIACIDTIGTEADMNTYRFSYITLLFASGGGCAAENYKTNNPQAARLVLGALGVFTLFCIREPFRVHSIIKRTAKDSLWRRKKLRTERLRRKIEKIVNEQLFRVKEATR